MQVRFKSLLMIAASAISLITVPAAAHHSFAAEFDAEQPLTLEGTVTMMEWINPHAWIHIDVIKDDGDVESWMIEGGAPNALLRRGWTRDALPEGTEIVVSGYRARDGSNRANGREITFPDGTQLFVGSSGIGAPYEEELREQERGQ